MIIHGRIVGVGSVALAVLAAGMCAAATAAPSPAQLDKLDPGARIGGRTVVGSDRADRLVGGPGIDVVDALGGPDRVRGMAGADQIAGGAGDDVLLGGPGSDVLRGGRGDDHIDGGVGADRVIDHSGDDVVRAGPGDDVDVADGRGGDTVLCSPGFTGSVRADADDHVIGCPADTVTSQPPPGLGALAATGTAPVTGSGTEADPYVRQVSHKHARPNDIDQTPNYADWATECDQLLTYGRFHRECVMAFPPRPLTGWWANELVPSYSCPNVTGWREFDLTTKSYEPVGTSLPSGVEVRGLGPIGVSITLAMTGHLNDIPIRWQTGSGPGKSSATHWGFGTDSYQVVLHCVDA